MSGEFFDGGVTAEAVYGLLINARAIEAAAANRLARAISGEVIRWLQRRAGGPS